MPHRLLAALLLLTTATGGARACAIPVFRYALERWAPAAYEVFIFRRAALNDEQQRCVTRLRDVQQANINVIDVDLTTKPAPKHAKLAERLPADQPLPLLAIRAPDSDDKTPLACVAPVTDANVTKLLDSPIRREVINRLGRGETAVLLLARSGDRGRDEPVAKLLADSLPKLHKTPLPKPTDTGPQPLSKLPMKVVFSVAEIARKEPKEDAFLSMLFRSEPGLEAEKGPVVFVIFGRGRLLAALRGDDLNAEELTRVAQFLCGACSCQVKELNPGLDLLFTANWQGFVDGTAGKQK